MAGNIYDRYRTKVFVDSNVILEGQRLEDLPWGEIDPVGPILILFVPTVLREIDSKKRDGRLAPRAREFNRRVAPLITSSDPICVRLAGPKVDIGLADCEIVKWNSLHDLDPSEGDSRVIADILSVRGVPVEERIVLSQDINPLLLASRRGLKTFHMPESWLGKAEPSPHEKELMKFKRQVADYAKTEPEFNVEIEAADNQHIYKVASLNSDETTLLCEEILRQNPKIEQRTTGSSHRVLGLGTFDPAYDRNYAKYKDLVVPGFVQGIHKKLEVRLGQSPLRLNIKNIGKVRAEHMHVEVRIVGGWFNEKPIFGGAYPVAPRPEQDAFRPVDYLNSTQVFHKHTPGRHEVEVDLPSKAELFTAQCEDFRQGQCWEFEGFLWLNPCIEEPATIVVEVTAANFHGKALKHIKIKKRIQSAHVFDLIEQKSGRALVRPKIFPLLEKAREEENYSFIEWEK